MKHATWAAQILLMLVAVPALWAAPTTLPTTKPAPADRLTFLTLQLSSTEESIKAINAALRSSGYKAAVAAERAADAQKNNELMDRKGGAPVPWDQFYGRTARDFAVGVPPGTKITIKGKGQIVYPTNDPLRRPAQMDYIYRANNEQAAKAQQDVAALGKKIDALLARRRQLEGEQSSLWATISGESIQNREIGLRPLYRFKLKEAKAGPAARVEILRAAILFLRTTDKAVADELAIVSSRQDEAMKGLKEAVQSGEGSMRVRLADAMLAENLDVSDQNITRELLAISKRMADTCSNMSDAWRLALDGDAAQDEARKLKFRAALQESMLDFSENFGRMDDLIMKVAETWNMVVERGVASEDKLPVNERKKAQAESSPQVAAGSSTVKSADRPPAMEAGQSLFNGKSLAGWEGDERYWSVVDGVIRGKTTDKTITYLFARESYRNFQFQASFRYMSGNSGIMFRCEPAAQRFIPGGYEADIYLPGAIGKLAFDNQPIYRPDPALQKKIYRPYDWNTCAIEADGDHIRVWINDQLMSEHHHHGPESGRIAFQVAGHTEVYFRDVHIKVLP